MSSREQGWGPADFVELADDRAGGRGHGQDDLGDSMLANDIAELLGGPQNGDAMNPEPLFIQCIIQESDHTATERGMSNQLLRHHQTRFSCAKDERSMVLGFASDSCGSLSIIDPKIPIVLGPEEPTNAHPAAPGA